MVVNVKVIIELEMSNSELEQLTKLLTKSSKLADIRQILESIDGETTQELVDKIEEVRAKIKNQASKIILESKIQRIYLEKVDVGDDNE